MAAGPGYKPPMSKVLSVLMAGKTARDEEEDIAEDIALLRHAMQNRAAVDDALKEVDTVVGPNASAQEIADVLKKA